MANEDTAAGKSKSKGNKSKEWKLEHSLEDLVHGQIVIITARWILVLVGLIQVLWNPVPISQLRVQILILLVLAIFNFILHAQLLRKTAPDKKIWYAASAFDLGVISILIISQGAFASNTYVYYFPAILAFSVAFPSSVTWFYTAGVVALYGLVGLSSISAEGDSQILFVRLLILAAVAMCGNLYWRIEGNRRHEAQTSQSDLVSQIRKRKTA